jgi:hypothetical protein
VTGARPTTPTSIVGSSPAIPAEARRLRAVLSGRLTRYQIAMVCLLAVVLAFYMWTAATSLPFSFSPSNNDLYNELTTAFLHGHTYLPIKPPAGLLHLADPYNPVQNAPYNAAYHDLSLWKGHFYSQWGPTPVLTLFMPFRLTTLHMSESFAVALYAFIGLVCAVLLLHVLVDRFVPRTPRWLLFVASAGLALTNTVPFLLRRPIQYEVAISCGYCFEMAGLLLVLTAVLGPRVRRPRLGWGSLCLGLAMGGRPTLVLGGAVALAATLWAIRHRDEPYTVLAYALGPLVLCGLLLGLYNQVRFGAITNFGERYELAGIDQTKTQFYRLAYVLPGLFSYFLVPARLALTFPHAFLMTATADPFSLPRGYVGTPQLPFAEPAGGVLTTMPITLSLLGLPFLWRQRRPGERHAVLAATGLAALGLAIVTLVSWALFGTTERYEVDFATLFLIPAFLIWALLLARHRPGTTARRVVAIAGVALTAFGAAVGTAVSFTGYEDLLRLEHPALFDTLEDLTSPFAALATMIPGKPEIARVDNGTLPVTFLPASYGSVTESGASAWLGTIPVTVTVISPGRRQLGLGATVMPGTGAPPPSRLTVRVSSPGHKAVTVPVISHDIRMPISVHWGLNRIRVTIAGTPTSPLELQLGNLQLIP